jgi:hypothetical protein
MATGPLALALALVAAALVAVPRAGLVTGAPVRRRWDPRMHRALLAGIGAAAAGTLLGLPWWCDLVAFGGAAGAARIAPRRRSGPSLPELREVAAVLDLVAVCLDAGLTITRAIGAALPATGLGGVDGSGTVTGSGVVAGSGTVAGSSRRGPGASAGPDALAALAEVVALLTLGADPVAAWRPAAGHEVLGALAAAAQRSALGGVRLADAARESAAEVRARCRRIGARSAGRASVAITAPLTMCFLPAFVCLGLAPVIVSLVAGLHLW